MKVDIIIPVKKINDYIYESLKKIEKLNYEDFGVIIFPDSHDGESFPRTKIIETGNVGPAQKRNLALKHSRADILAFLDDDAYPREDWLINAVRHFADGDIAAVGGPAVTPSSDTFFQRVSGAVFLSKAGGGFPERYWPEGKIREVDDWPSVNLLVRRDVFEKIGGFNSDYWPGEDTKLCLDIVKTGGKILYDPDVFVWHHRREGLIRHLRQIGRYGVHRGFFAKKLPETSRKFNYFIPSLFVLYLAIGTMLPFMHNTYLKGMYLTGIVLYLAALVYCFFEIYNREKNVGISSVSLLYIFFTHIWYGIRFTQGFLFTKELKSKLRKQT